MEKFKNYLWVLNLIGIAGIALFAASLFAKVSVARILSDNESSRKKEAAVSVSAASSGDEVDALPLKLKEDYQGIIDRNIFDSENRISREPDPAELAILEIPVIPEPVLDLNSPPVASSVSAILISTLVRADPNKTTAAIKVEGKTEIYKVGDAFADVEKITEIKRGRVVFIRNFHREYLDMDPTETLSSSPSYGSSYSTYPVTPAETPPASSPRNWSEGISKKSESHFMIEKSKFDASLRDINDILNDAASMPVHENGKVVGYQIMAIEPESIYEHLGIIDGDIITKVNGKAINSVESALNFIQSLKGLSNFNIDVKRDGSARHYTYEVK